MGRKDSKAKAKAKAKAPATESDHEEEVASGYSTDEVRFDSCISGIDVNEACWVRFLGSSSSHIPMVSCHSLDPSCTSSWSLSASPRTIMLFYPLRVDGKGGALPTMPKAGRHLCLTW